MKNILVIEDEKMLGAIYRDHLNDEGFETKWIASFEKAEAISKKFSADLILLDHGLSESGMTGIEAIPFLKKLFPSAYIVILSNYSDFVLAEKAIAAGAQDYWLKVNTSLKELVEKIKKLND